ncbi:MAG: hypothetical protein HY286_08095 [Planctomycetes bacterium]|nr:hypothetical protein [Planctomycetota bacterium]
MRGYRLEVPAGLTLTVAAGLAMQRRDLSVVAIAGDMEARTAGLLALHAVGKRGPKLLYLILDNGIAAQSAGSFSEALPVAGAGCLELCIQANFAFVASGIAADTESAATFIREAMEFEGSAAVVLRSACTTFHDEGSDLAMRASMQAVPREHPADDALGALSLARRSDVVWSGVLLKRRRS